MVSSHAYMQPHSLPRFGVYPKQSRSAVNAGGLRIGIDCPTLWKMVLDNEDGRLVRRILYDVFLFGHPYKDATEAAVRGLLFDVV